MTTRRWSSRSSRALAGKAAAFGSCARSAPNSRPSPPGSAWQDLKVGMGALRLFEGCAVVSDVGWIRESTRLTSFLMPCPVRVFGSQERDEALRWLTSLPEGPGISHRLTESEVLVIEVEKTLRAPDFDALALTVDSWLRAHAELAGVVTHAREFPGWENIGGLNPSCAVYSRPSPEGREDRAGSRQQDRHPGTSACEPFRPGGSAAIRIRRTQRRPCVGSRPPDALGGFVWISRSLVQVCR
ncbi:STAS/SEC14 domain-containing protein [Streptomyces caniferus]|uniref:STAS/SEC14 domain-containing protein n=1 Tax=Streptomyces caniferus TaxID=285557 RepID=UPI003F4CE646